MLGTKGSIANTIQGVPSMEGWAGVIMAAGKGTRMKSKVPKILHKVCGQELVVYPLKALREAGMRRIVVVVSPDTEEDVKALLGEDVEYIRQAQPLGTGHAILQASSLLKGQVDQILALGADSPLISPTTLQRLSSYHFSRDSWLTLLSATSSSGHAMGRIVRNNTGKVTEIIEDSELSEGDREDGPRG